MILTADLIKRFCESNIIRVLAVLVSAIIKLPKDIQNSLIRFNRYRKNMTKKFILIFKSSAISDVSLLDDRPTSTERFCYTSSHYTSTIYLMADNIFRCVKNVPNNCFNH